MLDKATLKHLRDDYIVNGERCEYCGAPMECFDHKIPISRGGTNSITNLACSCISCNSQKGDNTLEEYVRMLKNKITHLENNKIKKFEIVKHITRYISMRISEVASSTIGNQLSAEAIHELTEYYFNDYENGCGKLEG